MKMMQKLAALAAFAFGLMATPAFAEDATTYTQPGPCGGNQCYDSFLGVQIGGDALSGGFGTSVFEGSEGMNEVLKQGYAKSETTLEIAGPLCGVECSDGSFTFSGSAGELVQTMTQAKGAESGVATSALNQAGAFSGVTFQFGKLNVSP
ncbi:hypothetical protein KC902_02040 [Candidatus Kaiserbacteria bacterium]|nr:hypothetical protein [Candidatus Kaiserbacteria bacterium]USN88999.1 MAG: hypothetical protein H6780_01065 [Candidatus Nomurabacteria bacterium]